MKIKFGIEITIYLIQEIISVWGLSVEVLEDAQFLKYHKPQGFYIHQYYDSI